MTPHERRAVVIFAAAVVIVACFVQDIREATQA